MPPDPDLAPTDLAYVGILAHSRLLREVVHAVSERPDLTLRIAGFGPIGEEIAEIAHRCENIDYRGKVSVDEGLRIMNAGTMMFATYDPTIANHRYSAPNKFAEALALGKPLIVCRGTSIDVEVEETGFGAVIDYDADQFITAVDRILADDTLRERCRTLGPDYYFAHHAWSINAERLDEIYARTIAGPGRST
jgi:glycosyltransferase involved in cell wall biosynthesis